MERKISTALFICRFFSASSMIYAFAGVVLSLRTFADGLVALGLGPWAVNLTGVICVIGFLLSCCVLLGYKTRLTAALLFVIGIAAGFVFAANNINKVYISFVLFMLSGLMPMLLLGGGQISMDQKMMLDKKKKFLTR